MSEQRGEISEVAGLSTDAVPTDGDTMPDAASANQVADGEPKNYSEANADDDLREREAHRSELP